MALRGTPLPMAVILRIVRLRASLSVRATARAAAVSPATVQKYARRSLAQQPARLPQTT